MRVSWMFKTLIRKRYGKTRSKALYYDRDLTEEENFENKREEVLTRNRIKLAWGVTLKNCFIKDFQIKKAKKLLINYLEDSSTIF
jgi:hypothetical protein